MRPTTVPAEIDATRRPATIGSVRSPDDVAETPLTYCRYVGRKVIAPSIAKPTTIAMTEDSENTGLVNSRSGSIGSVARRSAQMKTGTASTAAAISPMMNAESQGYSVPPRLVARVSPAATTEIAATPA